MLTLPVRRAIAAGFFIAWRQDLGRIALKAVASSLPTGRGDRSPVERAPLRPQNLAAESRTLLRIGAEQCDLLCHTSASEASVRGA